MKHFYLLFIAVFFTFNTYSQRGGIGLFNPIKSQVLFCGEINNENPTAVFCAIDEHYIIDGETFELVHDKRYEIVDRFGNRRCKIISNKK